ncbi:MAG: ABC transporter permease [Thermoleophilaceae bacterium]
MSANAATIDVGGRLRGHARQLVAWRDSGIVVAFVVLFVVLSVSSDVFLTKTNLLHILDQQSGILIMAAAGTLVLIAGGFDLAIGATFALSGVVAAKLAVDISPWLALTAGMGTGLAVGLANGLLTTVGRVNSLIGTLATGFIIRGLAPIVTAGAIITVSGASAPDFQTLGNGHLLGVKYTIWVMAAFVGAMWLVLSRTTLGRYIYAAGANPEAARLAGVRVAAVRTGTFVLSGLAAGLAGVMAASTVATGQPGAGAGIEFTVIAGIVVGGTSIMGGQGAVWRSVLGVLFIALIDNGFTLLGLDPIYQRMAQGAIILLAVSIDAWGRDSR